MPCKDGTGPAGMGPRTGWAEGLCAGTPADSRVNFVGGFGGNGCGFGMRRRGHRNMFWATGLPRWARSGVGQSDAGQATRTPRDETEERIEALRQQAQSLENTLTEVRGQIERLEAKPGKETI